MTVDVIVLNCIACDSTDSTSDSTGSTCDSTDLHHMW